LHLRITFKSLGIIKIILEKVYFNADALKWIPQPPTEKGPWEKADWGQNEQNTEILKEIMKALQNAGKPLFHDGTLYWLLTDDTGRLRGVGRRVKQK
jgi:hypothetical protein